MTVLKERIREKRSPVGVPCPGFMHREGQGGVVWQPVSMSFCYMGQSGLQGHEYPLRELLKIVFRSPTEFKSLKELGEMNILKDFRDLGPTLELLNQLSRVRARALNCG